MTLAMNSTVISGTPRTVSMKITHSILMTGIFERRPSASRMPSGSDTAMPTKDRTSVTSSPPHSEVSTCGRPNMPPTSRKKATNGNAPKNRMAFSPLRGTRGISSGTSSATNRMATRIGRQRSSIG